MKTICSRATTNRQNFLAAFTDALSICNKKVLYSKITNTHKYGKYIINFLLQVELRSIFQSYLEQCHEINDIIYDFLKELLLGKPEDPISFAGEYFTDFYDD